MNYSYKSRRECPWWYEKFYSTVDKEKNQGYQQLFHGFYRFGRTFSHFLSLCAEKSALFISEDKFTLKSGKNANMLVMSSGEWKNYKV